MFKNCLLATFALLLALHLPAQHITLQRSYISVVVDASLSMGQPLGNVSKIAAVQENISALFAKIDEYPELIASLSAFGTARSSTDPQQCTDYKFLVPFDLGNTSRLNAALKRIAPFGTSPLANAMRTSVKSLPNEDAKKYVIIFTDGGDSCMELICDEFEQQDSLTSGIFFVGVGIATEDQELFECTSTFANADSSAELADAIERIFDVIKPY